MEAPRPVAGSLPRRSYFICATPRCGSWFLSGLLASTGLAGCPHEWFWRDTRATLERAWGARDAQEFLSVDVPPDLTVRPLTLAQPNATAGDWARRYRDET